MNTKLITRTLIQRGALLLPALLLSTLIHQPSTAHAQGTTITYQGRLNDGGTPANGAYDFRFRVYDAATNGNFSGGTIMLPSVGVTNGLFAVSLTFGGSAFNGSARWLQIGVAPGGSGGPYTNVEPRQPITAAPYAITAGNVTGAIADSQLSANIARLDSNATFTGAVLFNNPTSQFAGSFTGNGAGVTNLNLPVNSAGAISPLSSFFSLAFNPAVGYAADVVPADVNGDGKVDLICSEVITPAIDVLTNDGKGGFMFVSNFGGPGHSTGVVIADFNGDGIPDVASSQNISHSFAIFTNNGSGGFTLATNVAVPSDPASIVAADVNADGRVDLIAPDGNNSLFVVFNNHPNGFILASTPTVGLYPNRVAVADVNGDNKVDLISANSGTNTLTVLTNNGFGFFTLRTNLTVGLNPQFVVAADVNGDGKADLISANYAPNTLSVLTNAGNGAFALAASLPVGTGPLALTAGDVNADGKVDLISANTVDNTLSVLTNNGTGGFSLAQTPALNADVSNVGYVAAADLNSDGRVDLVAARGFHTLAVFLNMPLRFQGDFNGSFSGSFYGNFTGSGAGLVGVDAFNLTGTLPDGRLSANVAMLNNSLGFKLNAADQPMITRGWDPFTSGAYAGAGRWGMFMESSHLKIGMPALAGKYVDVVKYNADGTSSPLVTVDQSGNLYTAGAVNPPSDRNVKCDFESVDARVVLEKVAALPIQTWSYTNDAGGARHLGPVAQDFQAAFGLGADEKHIATVDADGVALAAIQGLNQKVDERTTRLEKELQRRDAENAELKARLNKLERLMNQQNGGAK